MCPVWRRIGSASEYGLCLVWVPCHCVFFNQTMSRRSALLVAGADGHGSLQSQWPFKMLMLMQHGWIDMQLVYANHLFESVKRQNPKVVDFFFHPIGYRGLIKIYIIMISLYHPICYWLQPSWLKNYFIARVGLSPSFSGWRWFDTTGHDEHGAHGCLALPCSAAAKCNSFTKKRENCTNLHEPIGPIHINSLDFIVYFIIALLHYHFISTFCDTVCVLFCFQVSTLSSSELCVITGTIGPSAWRCLVHCHGFLQKDTRCQQKN